MLAYEDFPTSFYKGDYQGYIFAFPTFEMNRRHAGAINLF